MEQCRNIKLKKLALEFPTYAKCYDIVHKGTYFNFKRCNTTKREKHSKMKFGKRFRIKISIIMPQWERECMSYKDLKKILKLMDPESRDEGFKQLLKNELVKMNEFFSKKEEEYNNRFEELKREVADLECDEDETQVIDDLLQFHNKLVLLLRYHELNFDGFLKIIKKHRKKTGELFSLSFMQGDNKKLVFIANSLDKLLAEFLETLRMLVQIQPK
ncbi:hypothetical protein QVD17_10979 [Tagetes erecta]|uniref:SPX domain-containing protein n=1 Tax=Tagetes erecta TaxID=13708 RepID=A0AAD8L7L2_TARER|nr:hypothetical protein QVD17_10979 [Tagetes erecta]